MYSSGRFLVNHGWARMPSTVMRSFGSTVKMRRRRSFASSVICMGMLKEALAMFLMRERVSAWSPVDIGDGRADGV